MAEGPWASWIAKLLTYSDKRLPKDYLIIHMQPQTMGWPNVKGRAQQEKHKTVQVAFLTANLINSIQADKSVDQATQV